MLAAIARMPVTHFESALGAAVGLCPGSYFELRHCLISFAWPHVVAIAISLLGMRLIVVYLRRQAKAH